MTRDPIALAARLRQKADAYEARHPARAAALRGLADNVAKETVLSQTKEALQPPKEVALTRDEAKAIVLVARNRAEYLHTAVAEVLASDPSMPVGRALDEAQHLEAAAERICHVHGITDADFYLGPDGNYT